MYSRGHNKIFYKSKIKEEQFVEIDILNPKLERSDRWKMSFLEDGTYYIDVRFKYIGSYYFRVYENGEEKHHDILTVSSNNSVIIPYQENIVEEI